MISARWMGLVVLGTLSAAGCGPDEVEALPPLERPSPEQRAGLPELRGRWLFAGFEVPAEDTARINAEVYRMLPPGEIRVLTQRMDSVAGQYGVPGQFILPFSGEVRRDGAFAVVLAGGEAGQQFMSGRVVRDTLWMELSSLSAAASWPPRARVAFARQPRTPPFTRLLGGMPIVTGPDSATLAAMARDSARLDSLRQAAQAPPPAAAAPTPPAAPPGAGAPPAQPQVPPRREVPPAAQPPADTPRRREPVPPPDRPARIDTVRLDPRRDTATGLPPAPPPRQPDTPPPAPPAPRDTLRIPGG